MAQDVATLGIIDDSLDWNPPAALPLNLRTHLGKFGIGGDDLIVIEGLPEGADLTVGISKPDGSWSIRAAEADGVAFIPLYENGETYTLKVCLLTPDPSDHGLPKMKGKAQFSLSVPLAALPVLEAFEEPKKAAAKTAATKTEAVIALGADPALKAAPAAAPQAIAAPAQPAPAPQPAAAAPVAVAPAAPSAASVAPIAAPAPTAAPALTAPIAMPAPAAPSQPIDLDKHFAALRAEWQTNVKNQIAAAEKRLKAGHLQQLSKIQTVLSQEEATRTTAIAAKWKAELDRRAADAETELKARAKEHLVGLEAGRPSEGAAADFDQRLAEARQQWKVEEEARLAAVEAEWSAAAAMMQGPTRTNAADPAAVERAVAEARAAWEIEEAARRAKDAAELAAAHQRQVAQLEAQYAALHDMRMGNAETTWRKSEADRLAAAEMEWGKREAERVAGVEAKWRAEHDKRLEVVLANLDTMVKGQIGNIDGSQPLPAIEPLPAAPAAQSEASETAAAEDDIRWRKTAAA